jgi:YD repeat-containing protein
LEIAERCGLRRCDAGRKATQRASVIQVEDLIGQLISTDRTAAQCATYGYDAQGNHVSIRDNVYQTAAGIFYEHGGTAGDFSQAYDTRVTELTYDAQGRQTSRTLPLGVATPADPRRLRRAALLQRPLAGGSRRRQ